MTFDVDVLVGGIDFDLPGNGGPECRDHVTFGRRVFETGRNSGAKTSEREGEREKRTFCPLLGKGGRGWQKSVLAKCETAGSQPSVGAWVRAESPPGFVPPELVPTVEHSGGTWNSAQFQ